MANELRDSRPLALSGRGRVFAQFLTHNFTHISSSNVYKSVGGAMYVKEVVSEGKTTFYERRTCLLSLVVCKCFLESRRKCEIGASKNDVCKLFGFFTPPVTVKIT